MSEIRLKQSWELPSEPKPIVIIGCGGIVDDAHLPAYELAGFKVAGLFDVNPEKSRRLADKWGVGVFDSLDEAVANRDVVFDLALPPAVHTSVLPALPEGSTVLIQKPMGQDLEQASSIAQICRERKLTAAVNFQLRFAPMMLAVRDALDKDMLGELLDVEVHLNLLTPWHLFPFLIGASRVEISVHSIHYLDLIRSLLGNPSSVQARTMGHPATELAQTRTSANLVYTGDKRATMSINHNHSFGRKFQTAQIRFEGTKGCAVVKLGLLLNYPTGEPDEFWISSGDVDWQQVPLTGSWFPHAFIGTMSNLQRFASGEDQSLETSVEDAWHTMALVEAAFQSAAQPGTPVLDAPPQAQTFASF